MFRRRMTTLIAVPLLVAACSSPGSSAGPSSGGAPSSGAGASQAGAASGAPGASTPAASQGAGGGSGVASANLNVGTGSRAGDYTATLVNGGCARNFSGANSFTVSSDQVEATGGFMGPMLSIFDATAAAAGTDNFVFGAPFDNYAETYELVPGSSGRGTGTVKLTDKGATATITVDGTTADGITLKATIECHQVTG